ncbi:MAG: universal stress protein [Bauldia sp.]|nr:universal stress protein [Bauldia sp.]
MPVRNVHVIVGEEDQPARAAVYLAARFGAHLTALSIEEQPELTHYMDEARAVVRRRVAGDRARFVALAEAGGVGFSVADLAVPVDGNLNEILQRGRLSDLVVVGRAAAGDEFHSELIRRLLLDSAAPVLVVPTGDSRFERAAIAWDGRSVAAQAIHSAVPFLKLATMVTIVSVVPRGGEPEPDTEELTSYLAHHGILAGHRTVAGGGSVADALLGFVRSERIDWITMGAFGRSRLNELLFGSPTREMLKETTVPLLMHH